MADLVRKVERWPEADRVPKIELKRFIVGEEAIRALPGALRELTTGGSDELVLVLDKVPYLRQGANVKPLVISMLADAGFHVHVVELEGDQDGIVHPDFHEVEHVKGNLKPGVAVATVGSGVISDITKHACFQFDEEHAAEPHLPLIFCMTANSVPAYASRMAIITKDGVKRTWPSRLPDVIIADLRILSEAPLEYTMGGIGDMCAMFMAFADWYLGNYFGIGSYFHGSWYILEDVKELMFAYAGEINQRTLLGMEVLAKIETLGGLSMTYARESAPLSGFEHVVSHMLDMGAPFWGRRIANHGSQVAVAAIPGLIGLNRFLDDFDPKKVDLDACYPAAEAMERRVRGTFDALDGSGAMGAECWSDYRQKLKGWGDARARCEEFLADWEKQRTHLRSLIMGVEPYVRALAAARHPLLFEELNVSVPEEQGRWAYHNAHLMRKRFSSGDLLYYFGWFTEAWTDGVFARMHQLVDEARREQATVAVV
jgi:glycerol-1-phosphate dehydrogenase [NAD(P)+]